MPRADTAARATRDAYVLRLFLAGHSYSQIGKHPKVNLSPKGVGNVVNRQLAEATPRQLSQHGAAIHIERLELMLRAAWPQAIQGNLKAVMVCLRVLKLEAKFHGLDDGDDQAVELLDGPNPLELFRLRQHPSDA